jgi:hypothetical protein
MTEETVHITRRAFRDYDAQEFLCRLSLPPTAYFVVADLRNGKVRVKYTTTTTTIKKEQWA